MLSPYYPAIATAAITINGVANAHNAGNAWQNMQTDFFITDFSPKCHLFN
jgi:hypothetical protein